MERDFRTDYCYGCLIGHLLNVYDIQISLLDLCRLEVVVHQVKRNGTRCCMHSFLMQFYDTVCMQGGSAWVLWSEVSHAPVQLPGVIKLTRHRLWGPFVL